MNYSLHIIELVWWMYIWNKNLCKVLYIWLEWYDWVPHFHCYSCWCVSQI